MYWKTSQDTHSPRQCGCCFILQGLGFPKSKIRVITLSVNLPDLIKICKNKSIRHLCTMQWIMLYFKIPIPLPICLFLWMSPYERIKHLFPIDIMLLALTSGTEAERTCVHLNASFESFLVALPCSQFSPQRGKQSQNSLFRLLNFYAV